MFIDDVGQPGPSGRPSRIGQAPATAQVSIFDAGKLVSDLSKAGDRISKVKAGLPRIPAGAPERAMAEAAVAKATASWDGAIRAKNLIPGLLTSVAAIGKGYVELPADDYQAVRTLLDAIREAELAVKAYRPPAGPGRTIMMPVIERVKEVPVWAWGLGAAGAAVLLAALLMGGRRGSPAPAPAPAKVAGSLGAIRASKRRRRKAAYGNPWAICTSSVGRSNPKKYERCVMSVKRRMAMSGIGDDMASAPPKAFMDRCVRRVAANPDVDDAAAACANSWMNRMSPEGRARYGR